MLSTTKLGGRLPAPKIAIVVGTTREGRFGDKPARWIFELGKTREGLEFEIVDLRDFPLPFFDETKPPSAMPATRPEAQRWASKVAEFDGFIFITAEYNHGMAAVLKNALDYAYHEFNRKAAAFVGYGAVGGARAIEQLRLVAVELQLAPLKHAVHIGMQELMGLRQGKSFADYPHLAQSAERVFDDLHWWARTLQGGRSAV